LFHPPSPDRAAGPFHWYFQFGSRIVLPEPAPHRRLVQLPDRRQFDGHRAHLVLGHQLTAVSSYVILYNGRRFMPCSPHQATNCAVLP
jgi:hypothetical protein